MAVDVGSAVGYLDLDISGFLNGLQSAQAQANTISQGIGKTLEGVGSNLKSAGTKWTTTLTAPIAALEGLSVKTAADFEAQMSKVSAISGATGKDLESLNEKAKEMGATTKFSASESAEAFQYMAMAGWKSGEMIDGIGGIMSLAAADGLDLATTSDIVTDALTAFGLKAGDAGHFADVLAAASSNANTNVAMLGESFKYVAPVAGAMGYSVEDVSVALGAMANAGIKASAGGTTLRTIISNMAKPTDEMKLAMEELGVSLDDGHGNMKSLMEVMQDLRKGMGNIKMPMEEYKKEVARINDEYEKGFRDEESYYTALEELAHKAYGAEGALKAEAAATLAGKTGLSGLLAIVNTADEDFEKLTDSIYTSEGAAKRMSDVMLDNLNGQFTLLKSQLEGVAIKFGNLLLPIVKKATEKISELVSWFDGLSESQQKTILVIASIVAAIGPLLVVLGVLISTVGKTITTYTNLATNISTKLIPAISGISAPVLAIVAVIGVLIAAFVNLWNTNEEFRKNITEMWEHLKLMFASFIHSFLEKVQELKTKTEPIIEKLKEIWNKFCELLAPLFEGAFATIISILKTAFDVILDVLDVFIAVFSGDWDSALESIKNIFYNVWQGIKNIFKNVIQTIENIADIFFGWFDTSWSEVWTSIKNFFVEIWTNITNYFSNITKKFSGLLDSIKNAFSEAWDVIKIIWDTVGPYFEKLWNFIKGTFAEVPNTLSNFFSWAWDGIKNIWDAVGPYFGAIWEGIKFIFSAVVDYFKMVFENAWIIIKTIWNVAIDFFQGIWDGIALVFSVVEGVLTGDFSDALENVKRIWETATKFFSDLWNGIKEVFSNVGVWFWQTFTGAYDNMVASLWNFVGHFEWLWNGVKGVFYNVAWFFGDTFGKGVDAIKNAFSNIGSFFDGVWTSLSDKARNGMNWIIEKVEWGINKIVDGLNWFGFDLPEVMGGGHVGFNLGYAYLPRLEQGGILKKGQVGLLEGNGTEAVIPLEKNLGWIKEIAKGITEYMVIDITPLVSIMTAYQEVSRSMLVSVNSAIQKQTETIEEMKDTRPEIPTGNTYNFYSPKPIDEYEAARQMERAERDLAEGYYV